MAEGVGAAIRVREGGGGGGGGGGSLKRKGLSEMGCVRVGEVIRVRQRGLMREERVV